MHFLDQRLAFWSYRYPMNQPRKQDSWGQHGAHLEQTGPMWAPWWPHELCYLERHEMAESCNTYVRYIVGVKTMSLRIFPTHEIFIFVISFPKTNIILAKIKYKTGVHINMLKENHTKRKICTYIAIHWKFYWNHAYIEQFCKTSKHVRFLSVIIIWSIHIFWWSERFGLHNHDD